MPTTNRPFFSSFFAAFRQHPQLPKVSSGSASVLGPSNGSPYSSTASAISSPVAPPNTGATNTSNHRLSLSATSNEYLPLSEPPSPTLGPLTSHAATIAAAQAAAATFRSSRPVHAPSGTIGTAHRRARSVTRTTSQHQQPQRRHHHHHAQPPLPLALPMPMPLPSGSHSSSSSSMALTPSFSSSPTAYPTMTSSTTSAGYCTPVSMSPPSPFAARSRTPSLTRATTRQRRGSESSSDGWAIVPASGGGALGGSGSTTTSAGAAAAAAEKWYIGGRTATGEERFYKLGLVRRYTSTDRLSLDRLSL